MKRAQVNGIELEYEVVGSGEPVLLISPVIADAFLPLLSESALADRYQLIRYHKRGWVGSTHSLPPVSVATHAADAAALLEHVGVPRAHIAGHSSGAAVGAQLALDRPETVQTLALLELSLLSVPSGEAFFQQAEPAFDAYGSGDHERAIARFMSVVGGCDWTMCGRSSTSVCPEPWRRRSRTPTPSSVSGFLPWPSGRSVPNSPLPFAAPCCRCSGRRPNRCGWRSPRSSARRRPSPARPARPARRPGDGRLPREELHDRRLTKAVQPGGARRPALAVPVPAARNGPPVRPGTP
jgi:pimeloyl-ACP methyl ester carboxylesterase